MQKRTYAAAATIALMLLTACGEAAPESGPSDGNPATETKSFTVAFTSHGISHAPSLAALEQLRQDGYEIEAPVLAESELVTAGTAQGQFAFGVAATGSMLTAVSKGANLKAVVLRNANEWTVWGQQDISECADLDGKRLAIHSPGGDSTKMVERYVETTDRRAGAGHEPDEEADSGGPGEGEGALAPFRAGGQEVLPHGRGVDLAGHAVLAVADVLEHLGDAEESDHDGHEADAADQ